MKKVSVIIPCFNQGKYVKEAINSVLNQTYENIEIICINDGSVDNTAEIITSLADKYKILFFNFKENKGVIHARNFGIDASTGDYILPLDADDTIEPTYVEKAVKILDEKPEIGIVYCKAKKFKKKSKIWKLKEYKFESFLYRNCIFNCALFRKSNFLQAGKYKDNLKYGCEDWDLWLSLIELNLKPYQINEFLFNYRQHENSRSKLVNKNHEWQKELIKNHIDLYLNNDEFIERIFSKKQGKKYKFLYNTFLFFSLLELIIIAWMWIK